MSVSERNRGQVKYTYEVMDVCAHQRFDPGVLGGRGTDEYALFGQACGESQARHRVPWLLGRARRSLDVVAGMSRLLGQTMESEAARGHTQTHGGMVFCVVVGFEGVDQGEKDDEDHVETHGG